VTTPEEPTCEVSRRRIIGTGLLAMIMGLVSPEVAEPISLSAFKQRLDEYGRRAAATRRDHTGDNLASARKEILAKEREIIKVLYAYLEEMERDIFARKWDTLAEYVKVFAKQVS
jgi:hypothetical protein